MALVDMESAEVSPESDELARRIYAYMGTEASLLEKVSGRVLARRSAHLALWCCVALGVHITAAANIESKTAPAISAIQPLLLIPVRSPGGYDPPDPAARILYISLVSWNEMHVSVIDGLSGCGSGVEPDVVARGRIFPFN